MNNKLVGLLVIKQDNHENKHRRTSDIQSINRTKKQIRSHSFIDSEASVSFNQV